MGHVIQPDLIHQKQGAVNVFYCALPKGRALRNKFNIEINLAAFLLCENAPIIQYFSQRKL